MEILIKYDARWPGKDDFFPFQHLTEETDWSADYSGEWPGKGPQNRQNQNCHPQQTCQM